MDRSEDIEILEFARRENRVCITLDHDFHTYIALTRMSGPSVVLLRIEGLKAAAQVNLIRAVWMSHADVIDAGAAVSVDAVSVRVRKLPLR
ncbi:MAG: DUF5615 family PIN-like protein [Bryobacterales bacterium]|nr:DUF5615 family PIN-like protein [Bryobacterales bacterium]